MMKPTSDVPNKGIEGILELSADAQIRRRGTVKDSPEFHSLTGAIVAYGKALAVLKALQQPEEYYRFPAVSNMLLQLNQWFSHV